MIDLYDDANPWQSAADAQPENAAQRRKYVGVYFDCCNLYARIYRNAAGTQYAGACPRCQARVELDIGPGGTSNRFFRAK